MRRQKIMTLSRKHTKPLVKEVYGRRACDPVGMLRCLTTDVSGGDLPPLVRETDIDGLEEFDPPRMADIGGARGIASWVMLGAQFEGFYHGKRRKNDER